MKQINVPVEDETYARVKMASVHAGLKLKGWVDRELAAAADRELADSRAHRIPHVGITDGHSVPAGKTKRATIQEPLSLSERMRQMRENS